MNGIGICPDCGGRAFFIKKASYNAAVYCRRCGKVVGRVKGESDIRSIVKQMMDYDAVIGDEKYALKILKEINGVTKYRCSSCKALLFTSDNPERGGQISLKDDAKYCPMCGKEFLFTVSK